MKTFARAMGFVGLVLSTGVWAEEPVVSNKNLAGYAGGTAWMLGSEALLSGKVGGKGPSHLYDAQTLRHWIVSESLIDKKIQDKQLELMKALGRNLADVELSTQALANKEVGPLNGSTAARFMKHHLSETAEAVSAQAEARALKSEKAIQKLEAEIAHLNKFKLNFDYGRFGTTAGKIPLRELGRFLGIAPGLYLYGNETAQILVKWDAKMKRLREPTLEDLQDAQLYRKSAVKKLDRKPAVLMGKNGAIQSKYLTPAELDEETSSHSAQVSSDPK